MIPAAVVKPPRAWPAVPMAFLLLALGLSPARAQEAPADAGIPVTHEATVRACGACHRVDDAGRMSRISYLRKTPEGWQTSIRRMVMLHGVSLEPEQARAIVRYLSNEHGLAPEELRPALWGVERRHHGVDFEFPNDDVRQTCGACHTLARVITQRRTAEEWSLLLETHRGLYPLVDRQVFQRDRPPPDVDRDAEYPDPGERAAEYLGETYPLETPAWSAWSANMRPAELAGTWALEGYDPARGPFYGTMTVRAAPGPDDGLTTTARYVYPEGGEQVSRTGQAVVYTGYQWRGRSSAEAGGPDGELREVMMVERGWRAMSGRWFTGEYDEIAVTVELHRAGVEPRILGVWPRAVKAGAEDARVRVHGVNLPERFAAGEVSFGPGVRVTAVEETEPGEAVLRLAVDGDAPAGVRDLVLAGVSAPEAVVVYDRVHRLSVEPEAGMARVGGVAMPKQLQQFEAIAWHNGPDGKEDTEDDLQLGRVQAEWALEEFAFTYEDDDIDYVGTIDADGLFTPAADGPNPERSGNRNNVGDVWVVASWTPPGEAEPLRARAHLLVTVPLYMRWEPWEVTR